MKKYLLKLCWLLILLIPTALFAAQFLANKTDISSLGSGRIYKNLYLANRTVDMQTTVLGDLTVAGRNLNLGGKIENSLLALGQSIIFSGRLGRTARMAGRDIVIDGSVGEDLLVAGRSVKLTEHATIDEDLWAAGNNIELLGLVRGQARIAGETVVISGRINGDAKIYAQDIKILNSAVITGKLTYWSAQEALIASHATIRGGVTFEPVKEQKKNHEGVLKGKFLGLLVGFITVLAICYLLPKQTGELMAIVFKKPWQVLGWGLMFLILTPVILVLLMVSFIGYKLAFVCGLFYLLALTYSGFLMPFLAGTYVLSWFKQLKKPRPWLKALTGILVLTMLGLVPVLGSLIIFLVFLLLLGALTSATLNYFQSQRKGLKH